MRVFSLRSTQWRCFCLIVFLLPSLEATTEELVTEHPMVVVIRDFASPEECAAMLKVIERCHTSDWADCHEIRSRLHSNKTKGTGREGKRQWRNSTSFTLELAGEIEEPIVDTLVRRSHRLARHPITHGEGVQVASYHTGDYYEFHHDSLHRRATMLVYLTDLPDGDGGETIFPLVRASGVPVDREPPLPPAVLGYEKPGLDFKVGSMEEMTPYCESDYYLKIRPEAGKAILFFNYGPDYSLDQFAIHGACPVKRGHKAIFQRWMRFEENTLIGKASDAIKSQRSRNADQLLPPGKAPETTEQPLTEIEKLLRRPSRTSRDATRSASLTASDGQPTPGPTTATTEIFQEEHHPPEL